MVLISFRNNSSTSAKYSEHSIEININDPLLNQILSINDNEENLRSALTSKSNSIFLLKKEKDKNIKTKITDLSKSLQQLDYTNDDLIIIEKNALYVDARKVIAFAYLGPIIIFFYLAFRFGIYRLNPKQGIALILCLIHYSKRVYETLYVHPYGSDTVIFKQATGVIFYYWVAFGLLVGMSIFSQSFKAPNYLSYDKYLYICLMLFSEYRNYKCHIILKNLKEKNNGKRGIPYGDMFEMVSCANYFWELFSWWSFSNLIGTSESFNVRYFQFTFNGIYCMEQTQRIFEVLW
jgi:hypothetical protein